MHELSLATGVVEVLDEEARRHGIQRIQRVRIQIGALRAVVPELLRTAFEVAARGSLAEGAAMELETTPGSARCQKCGRRFELEDLLLFCPHCGAVGGEVLSGMELNLLEFEGE